MLAAAKQDCRCRRHNTACGSACCLGASAVAGICTSSNSICDRLKSSCGELQGQRQPGARDVQQQRAAHIDRLLESLSGRHAAPLAQAQAHGVLEHIHLSAGEEQALAGLQVADCGTRGGQALPSQQTAAA